MRRDLLAIERSLKALGTGYWMLCAVLAAVGWLIGFGSVRISVRGVGALEPSGDLRFTLALAAASVAVGGVGWGLRGLKRWARVPAALIAACCMVVGLGCFPINPLIALVACYVFASRLYFLADSRVARVLSREYAAAIRATPELNPRRGTLRLLVVLVLGLLLITTIVQLIFARLY